MSFVDTYQGSVNRWECDENDHQNVRFYLAKAHQGLVIALQKFCITDHPDANLALRHIRSHHIRFLREARVAVPLVIQCGVLQHQPQQSMQLLSLMRNSASGELLAAFTSDIALTDLVTQPPTSEAVVATAEMQPKGVRATVSPYASLSYPEALQHGFIQIGAGVVSHVECDQTDRMAPHHFLGRISDGMPNLWAHYQSNEELETLGQGVLGGAVLEYRLQYHGDLQRGASYSHLAGIHALGNKTQAICHLIYDAGSGALVVSAEALSISMDLQTRKSIAIPAARRERIESLILRNPAG